MKQTFIAALLVTGLAVQPAVGGMENARAPGAAQSFELKRGGTLDGLLTKAGLSARERFDVVEGLSKELDPGVLQPGLVMEVIRGDGERPEVLTFVLENHARLSLDPAHPDKITRVDPVTETLTEAGEITVGISIYAALEEAGIPEQFAADLDRIFGTAVDFRRDIHGGETVKMIWTREVNEAGETIGSTELSYAALDTSYELYEAVWPGENAARLAVFRDGDAIRVYTPPVTGARISSGFGMRRHPILGTRRLHAGVDFAAPTGTPVAASAAGTVTFAGRSGGYGNMVEISHGGSMKTRYAHLSSITGSIRKGSKVDADTLIGKVGSTGMSTGPHLHYEVHLDGKAVDPLSDERLADLDSNTEEEDSKALSAKRAQFRNLTVPAPLPAVTPKPETPVILG